MQSDQGLNPGPLHWEHGVLATGPLRKSPCRSLTCYGTWFFVGLTGSKSDAEILSFAAEKRIIWKAASENTGEPVSDTSPCR